jgi:long-chain acyl-CoA synthetase
VRPRCHWRWRLSLILGEEPSVEGDGERHGPRAGPVQPALADLRTYDDAVTVPTTLPLGGGAPDDIAGVLRWATGRWGEDHPILEDQEGGVSLGQLVGRTAAGMSAVHELGVRHGDRVAATLPNGRTILELFLATTCTGAIWVGLNQNLAGSEREVLLADCEPALSVGTSGGASAFDADGWNGLVDTHLGAEPAWGAASGGDPGAIAYTSGTTGMPKGVVHSQHNLLVPAASFAWSGRVAPGARVGVAFPLTILNLVIQSFLSSICAGATCCVLTRRDTPGMLEQIVANRVDQISVVPATAHDLVNQPRSAVGTALRRIMVGGSHVRGDLLHQLADHLGVDTETGYGLTEGPGLLTLSQAEEPQTAGRALPHVSVAVVDGNGNDVIDEEGEIVVRARTDGPWAGLWRPPLGYWARSDPPAGQPHALCTADSGVMDADGRLRVLDRRSELIIRGGSNVYPAEIERVLDSHPGVSAAVAVGRPDDRLGQVPVAFVELLPGTTVDAEELALLCHDRLAAFKVPEIEVVPDLPRNALAKVNRGWAKVRAEALGAERRTPAPSLIQVEPVSPGSHPRRGSRPDPPGGEPCSPARADTP